MAIVRRPGWLQRQEEQSRMQRARAEEETRERIGAEPGDYVRQLESRLAEAEARASRMAHELAQRDSVAYQYGWNAAQAVTETTPLNPYDAGTDPGYYVPRVTAVRTGRRMAAADGWEYSTAFPTYFIRRANEVSAASLPADDYNT